MHWGSDTPQRTRGRSRHVRQKNAQWRVMWPLGRRPFQLHGPGPALSLWVSSGVASGWAPDRAPPDRAPPAPTPSPEGGGRDLPSSHSALQRPYRVNAVCCLGLSAEAAPAGGGFGSPPRRQGPGVASLIRMGIFYHPTQNLHNWEGGRGEDPPRRSCIFHGLLPRSLAHFEFKGKMNRFEFFEINYHHCHGKMHPLPSSGS